MRVIAPLFVLPESHRKHILQCPGWFGDNPLFVTARTNGWYGIASEARWLFWFPYTNKTPSATTFVSAAQPEDYVKLCQEFPGLQERSVVPPSIFSRFRPVL